jgi:nucleoid DNA-binding protein
VTKKILANNISKNLGLNKNESINFINQLIKFIELGSSKKNLKIHNFGTFYRKNTKKRMGRNPKTLQSHLIAPVNKLFFKPSNKLKEYLN